MHCKCLDTRYAKRTSSDRLGHDLNNPYMQDNDLKHMTMATSAIRNNNKKKIYKCYSYTQFWYFMNSIQGSLKFFGQFKVTSQRLAWNLYRPHSIMSALF